MQNVGNNLKPGQKWHGKSNGGLKYLKVGYFFLRLLGMAAAKICQRKCDFELN